MTVLVISAFAIGICIVLYLSDTDFHREMDAKERRLKDFSEWEWARFPERPKRSSYSGIACPWRGK